MLPVGPGIPVDITGSQASNYEGSSVTHLILLHNNG